MVDAAGSSSGAAVILTASASVAGASVSNAASSGASAAVVLTIGASIASTYVADSSGGGVADRASIAGADDATVDVDTIVVAAAVLATISGAFVVAIVVAFCFFVFGGREFTIECIKDDAKRGVKCCFLLFLWYSASFLLFLLSMSLWTLFIVISAILISVSVNWWTWLSLYFLLVVVVKHP